ncbi:MAG TPA: 2-octaprenyl-6-methoxyphenyl hydroxylase [Gammaproteobacteria bacterium]|nr:2-octaprenyl-6-methoxyphenyl hydroxylase [Gammaproteobacteria bacterium]
MKRKVIAKHTKEPKSPRDVQVNDRPAVDFDILIAGGGMVGASLAAALAPLALKIAVVEAVRFGSRDQPSYDDRITAVSWGSRRIFEGIGLWPQIAPQATAIHCIHVSDRGHMGMTRLHAAEMGVEALGYVVPNRVIGSALSGFLERQKQVALLAPTKLEAVQMQAHAVCASLESSATKSVKSRLLVAADGANSKIREQLGIDTRVWDYGQSAVICNVSVERPQAYTAFERFTGDGPLALLPMGEERYALIWTVVNERVTGILAMTDAEFLAGAAAGFNGRLGRFIKAGKRQAYPLSLVRAQTQMKGRAVVVGNAAHSLHPIAGQGFNLSLRDIAALADTLADIIAVGGDPGDLRRLGAYIQTRRSDQTSTMLFTDMLARVFTNPLASVGWARNLGLLGLELFPPARHRLARHNMGINGRLPRLARGLGIKAGTDCLTWDTRMPFAITDTGQGPV